MTNEAKDGGAAVEKYRPSNGTEGECFMAEWCDRCAKDAKPLSCSIITDTMAYDVDDAEYPSEWVWDGKTPRCTAFEAREAQP
jgi:hypothetical protein